MKKMSFFLQKPEGKRKKPPFLKKQLSSFGEKRGETNEKYRNQKIGNTWSERTAGPVFRPPGSPHQ
ncbi:MAG TPA: hypothetical protein H9691_01675 [Firmicutes bacterium]|nr:hypothetical protein [Bacillota bacterium]